MIRLKTVQSAIRNRQFFHLLFPYLHKHLRIEKIRNGNIFYWNNQDKVYRKLKKKFSQEIYEGVIEGKREKSDKIWILWLQGEDCAPPLVKACINSVRKNAQEREVVILDQDSLKEYVDFPEEIWRKRDSGVIPNAQFSDLVRVDLLCRHGGVWIDATVLLTSIGEEYEYIVNAPLFVYKDMCLVKEDEMPIIASNWLISAHSNSKILLMTRKLLLEYWKRYDFLIDYYIFHFFFTMSAERFPEEWNEIAMYNNRTPHTMQLELANDYSEIRWNQLIEMSCFHKLNRYVDYNEKEKSLYSYIIERYCDK